MKKLHPQYYVVHKNYSFSTSKPQTSITNTFYNGLILEINSSGKHRKCETKEKLGREKQGEGVYNKWYYLHM